MIEKATWKSPFDWTEQEIHKLVMNEVGMDILFPRGSQVLLKLWVPEKENEYGLLISDTSQRNERITTSIGKVIRMGPEAYLDNRRFPMGPLVTYNEWVVFSQTQRQLIAVNDSYLAYVYDDRFLGMTTNPAKLQTSFNLEYQWTGA